MSGRKKDQVPGFFVTCSYTRAMRACVSGFFQSEVSQVCIGLIVKSGQPGRV